MRVDNFRRKLECIIFKKFYDIYCYVCVFFCREFEGLYCGKSGSKRFCEIEFIVFIDDVINNFVFGR